MKVEKSPRPPGDITRQDRQDHKGEEHTTEKLLGMGVHHRTETPDETTYDDTGTPEEDHHFVPDAICAPLVTQSTTVDHCERT